MTGACSTAARESIGQGFHPAGRIARPHIGRLVIILGLTGALAGCAAGDDRDSAQHPGVTNSPAGSDAARVRPLSAHDSALKAAALEVLDFLRGSANLDPATVADSVELRIPAEGGGGLRQLSRAAALSRDNWFVEVLGRPYSFEPPSDLPVLRVVPGRHINCFETSLASRIPDLGTAPHVGVRLEPARQESCLQGWNATFVFDTGGGRPTLRAVVYDQWEW
jgi:hypothetical protein